MGQMGNFNWGPVYLNNIVSTVTYFSECPGGVSNVCGGHGSCNDSVTGTGFCTCEVSYTGPDCKIVIQPFLKKVLGIL